jgi:hypothetical protein
VIIKELALRAGATGQTAHAAVLFLELTVSAQAAWRGTLRVRLSTGTLQVQGFCAVAGKHTVSGEHNACLSSLVYVANVIIGSIVVYIIMPCMKEYNV